MKIVFLLGYINSSHAKNRVLEFMEHGYDVEVYGFERKGRVGAEKTPYVCHSIGTLEDGVYLDRIKTYIKAFRKIKNTHGTKDVIYYINGLDRAFSFVFFNWKAKYIYEEADLVHTYMKSKWLFEHIDKMIIRKSFLTILTSEGFRIFHFGNNKLQNVCVIPNRLNPDVIKLPMCKKESFSSNCIHFGFVGKPRFKSIYNIIDVICSEFPNHSFDIFGGPIEEEFSELKKYANCHFHGFFNNPVDLPNIYSKIDVVVATYDVAYENVRYAEPNKIYEAIYFDTPILVSTNTFLAEKVAKLDIGFDIDPLDRKQIVEFVNSLSVDLMNKKKESISRIDKAETLNNNKDFFRALNRNIEDLRVYY